MNQGYLHHRPSNTEFAEYYSGYVDQVVGDDICAILEAQMPETLALLRGISEERSSHRYAPGKWSIREVVSHWNDTERAFVFRALSFARGLDAPLPSFNPDIAVPGAEADARSWASHIDEFQSVRQATLSFFRSLSADAWLRRGIAGNNPVSVRALAFISAGHVAHHVKILRERYL